ncbi:MAG: hypothetical protein JW955_15800 [Sedimentisphaerales bacterium]|nr:hypothetical protein [Sedimentisphaerales bacterium]
MARWKIIVLIVCIVLVTGGALTAHLILRSDLVGEMVLARASEELGMEVTARSLRVGWDGQTVVRELVVTMPLTNDVLFSAEAVRFSHAAVLWLVLGRSFNLQSVEVESPQVNVRRYEGGRWNVQEAWDRLSSVLQSSSPSPDVALPRIVIRDGMVHITGPNEVMQTVGPIEFQAGFRGRLLWDFDLRLPSMGGIEGQLLDGSDWAHRADFAIEGAGSLIRGLLGQDLSPIALTGQWEGRKSGDNLNGRVRLSNATFGPVALRGDVRVEAGRDAVTFRPEELVLTDPNLAAEDVHLAAGAIRITRAAVTVEQFAARAGTLIGYLDGRWDWSARAGAFSGSWTAESARDSQYRGMYKGTVQSPRLGRTQLDAALTAEARTIAGDWTVVANIRGAGADLGRSGWRVSVPQMAWSRNDRKAAISNTAAEIDVNWPVIRLMSLHVPSAEKASGGGEFDMGTRRWSAHLDVSALTLGLLEKDGIDVRVIAQGDDREALVSELRVAAGERVLFAKGGLSLTGGMLHDVSISADWPASPTDPVQLQSVRLAERWNLSAAVSGRIHPLALTVEGDLAGQNIPVGKQTVSHVMVPIRVTTDAERIQVATEPFELLSGRWQLTGQHELSSRLTQLSLLIDGISLKAAAEIAGSPLAIEGTAHAEMQLAVPGYQVKRAVATGRWTAQDVVIPPLEARKARGNLRVAGGLVRFEGIELEQGNGHARADMEFQLDCPQDVVVECTTQSWPMRLTEYPLAILADSQASLHVNVIRREVEGQMHLSGGVWYRDWDFARIDMDVLALGRTLEVQDLYAETLGGSAQGAARITLDHWSDSTANLAWSGIQPQLLQRWWPQSGRLRGDVSGNLVVEQTDPRRRPLGPMCFTVDAHSTGGQYGPAQVGGCRIVGYVDDSRVLVDDAILQAFGGRVSARARVSRHAQGYYASVITDFNGLDLDQLVHAADPDTREHVGRVSGRISLLASDQLTLNGEGDIRLTQSDLAGNPAIALLHSALNLDIGKRQPTGTGKVEIRFEGPRLVIQSFEYFNRGVEIRGAGQIGDIHAGDKSPVEGYAVAFTRVLKGISLPGVRSLDRLMASLQTGTAAVQMAGTLQQVEVKLVPLPIIGGDLRRLLWTQLRE